MAHAQPDVYVVYSRDSGAVRGQLIESLETDLTVKSYNANLLVIADYSGKQKAIARFGEAGLVVLVGKASAQLLKGATLKAPLVLVGGTTEGVRSEAWTLVVLSVEQAATLSEGSAVVVKSLEDVDSLSTVPGSVRTVVLDEEKLPLAKLIHRLARQTVRGS